MPSGILASYVVPEVWSETLGEQCLQEGTEVLRAEQAFLALSPC